MAKKFKKGDRVGYLDSGELRYDEYEDNAPIYGVITEALSDNRVLVKWDNDTCYGIRCIDNPFSQKVLQPEKELKAKYSELEKAFKAVEKQVRGKIKSAAKSITAAQKMAKKAGLNLIELTSALGPLETAMDKAGWHTSSWECPGF